MPGAVSFYFVDVFASRRLTGNPLSLVPDADGLDEWQMRAISREFNQSETTFLLRPTLPGAACRLRSFTPTGAEVGGAGHNALGAWLWLEAADRLPNRGSDLAQEIAGALLPVEVIRTDNPSRYRWTSHHSSVNRSEIEGSLPPLWRSTKMISERTRRRWSFRLAQLTSWFRCAIAQQWTAQHRTHRGSRRCSRRWARRAAISTAPIPWTPPARSPTPDSSTQPWASSKTLRPEPRQDRW
jgi:hypothetical protein